MVSYRAEYENHVLFSLLPILSTSKVRNMEKCFVLHINSTIFILFSHIHTDSLKEKKNFPNSMVKYAWYLGFFSNHLKIVIFYTEILNGKVVLWCFSWVKWVKKSTIQLF